MPEYSPYEVIQKSYEAALQGNCERVANLLGSIKPSSFSDQQRPTSKKPTVTEVILSLDWAEVADRISELESELEVLHVLEPLLKSRMDIQPSKPHKKPLKTRMKVALRNGPQHIDKLCVDLNATTGEIEHACNRSNRSLISDAGIIYTKDQYDKEQGQDKT